MNVRARLVLSSGLMLFIELALIRWLSANVVHLGYFSNFVLLGSFLGVGLGDTTSTVKGVYRSTPAAAAGIRAGDTITAVDGTTVRTSAALRRAVAAHSPGDSVGVTWTDASGTSHTATVTLADGPVK